jgi:transcriptional regulator NrdR family protein
MTGRRCRRHEIGLAILGPLCALDEVAYMRFASLYRGFESARTSRPRLPYSACGAALDKASAIPAFDG